MTSNPEVYLSASAVGAVLVGLLLFSAAAFFVLRKKSTIRFQGGIQDWTIPELDAYANGSSFFHEWDPRVKIATLFLYCFAVTALKTLFWSGIAFFIGILAVIACRIPLSRSLRRLAAMAGFLSMFLVVVPFTSPLRQGETLFFLPFLHAFPFHGRGFIVALQIVFKACAIGLMMEPMLATAALPVTLQALSRLGLPDAVSQMILLIHRYLFVFLHETKRIYRSMRVRGFSPRTDVATMNTMGNFFGMLFVRSFDRTQRVYDAMLSRGYNGAFPTFIHFENRGMDRIKALLWAMIGLALILLDRFQGAPPW